MSKFSPAWYLIYTKPNQEKKVASQLLEMETKFLLPTHEVCKQWHDRKKIIEKPLFPSYIFVQINSISEYFTYSNVDGFCSYVKFGNQPATISQETIESIDIISSKSVNVEITENSLQKGQKVLISKGPFCGLTCEVVCLSGRDMVCVRVNLLNRILLADIHSSTIAYGAVC